ncbi:MAG: methyltransferase domain-containing protein [Bacteroidia bacterium]|nr:methyltransferase domain-containing protein [Bacteroidia bacterium]
MKKKLDYQEREIANIFDEVTLWSAPFGRLLLEHMPMQAGATVLDIGFGTGFPLIELSQRFGEKSQIYGIDIWKEGIHRTQEKIDTLELSNIEILEESAEKIRLEDKHIDLITSNLGVNNFDRKEEVYQEIHRVLKKGGKLALTTNPIGTFEELFDLFATIFKEKKFLVEGKKLEKYIKHRNTAEGIISEFDQFGFKLTKEISDETNHRFVDAEALLNHSLMRIGFRASWDNLLEEMDKNLFYEDLLKRIGKIIETEGEFSIRIPMLYLEFEKV